MKNVALKLSILPFIVFNLLLTDYAFGQIEWKEYPFPLEDSLKSKIRFGYLTVPETRDEENSRTLRIGFCVLKSSANSPQKDAVIYLPGGPGQGYTDATPYFLMGKSINHILEQRDIVLFDPRGCGTSEPQLCGALENPEIFNANLSGMDQEAYMNMIAMVMRKCRDSLIGQGVNLDSYGSSDIAQDIEDLRLALGYETWNIRGHSYGSRYGQSIIRQYPDKVRSAVLSGLVPSTLAYEDSDFYGLIHALRLILNQCAVDPECNTAYPDLENDLLKLLTRVQKEPIILPPGATDLLPKSYMVLNSNAVLIGIFQAMYSREGIEMIPLLIRAILQGNDWVAEPLALSLGADYGLEYDMYHAILCNDNPGVSFSSQPIFQDALINLLYPYWVGNQKMVGEELCKNFSISLDSMEQVPLHSNIPMLLFTGEFDPVTPTYNTDSVVKYLSNATSFVVPGRGHDGSAPIPDLIADFFIDPVSKPDLSVLDTLEPVKFLTDVSLNEGVSAISVKIAKGNYLALSVMAGTILLLMLSGFVYFPFYWIGSLSKKAQGHIAVKNYLPIWILSLFGALFVILLYFAFKNALGTHPNLLAFGLPGKWRPIFYVVWIIMFLLILSLVATKKIWNNKTEKVPKLFWLLSWSGGLGLILFLWYWKLI
jgi:pimeloyl-ACP methyl ester carboxylesterase